MHILKSVKVMISKKNEMALKSSIKKKIIVRKNSEMVRGSKKNMKEKNNNSKLE